MLTERSFVVVSFTAIHYEVLLPNQKADNYMKRQNQVFPDVQWTSNVQKIGDGKI